MQSPPSSAPKVDINDIYALKIKALWNGLKQEHASFWFLCIYFMFEYVRPQSLYPAIDILPWPSLFMLLTLIAAFADKTVKWQSHTLNKWLALFCLIVVVSGLNSYYPKISWENRNIMISWVIAYFLVITIVNSERRLILFVLAYLLFNLKMGQHGALGWMSRGFSFASYGLIGAPGWFRNSGEYAIQMLIFGSLAIAFVLSLKDKWGRFTKWFMFAAASTGYITVLGTSSRGAQLALAAILSWWLLRVKGGFKVLIAVSIVAVMFYHLLPEEQISRFKESGEDATSLQRLEYWSIGIDLAEQHPVFGIGYKNWMPYVSRLYPEGVGPLEKVEVPHSIYIEAAAELGYAGLICFLGMIVTAFIVNHRTRRIAKEVSPAFIRYLTFGLDAGLIGFLVAGAFVTVLYYPFFWVQLAMIVMLNINVKIIAQKSE